MRITVLKEGNMKRHITVCCLVSLWGLTGVWAEAGQSATFLSPLAVAAAREGGTKTGMKVTNAPKSAATPRRRQVAQTCEQAALAVIRQQSSGHVQQVHLGDEGNPQSLSLAANTLLTGTGQIRQDAFWHDFYFSCEVSADGGEVLNFSYTLIS
jgi:hypothetical protein